MRLNAIYSSSQESRVQTLPAASSAVPTRTLGITAGMERYDVNAAAIAVAEAVEVALGGNGGTFEFLRWKRGNGETSNWSRRRERR